MPREASERKSGTMKMRWLTVVFVLAFLVPAGTWAQKVQKSEGAGPVLQIINTSHDFGRVFRSEKFVHDFVVRNVGNADLVIEDVKPG
jgi:hypothetical protein